MQKSSLQILIIAIQLLIFQPPATAQFMDAFDGTGTPKGWVSATGDGQATITFKQHNGIATLLVDATNDKLNIWWALTRRQVQGLDMNKLARPEYELRVEAKIRVSHAPRRVNLHVNHQRTTDFHSHLMEFDIPDTTNWHTISMTTRDFETQPGDSINAHLALMDWGQGKYNVDFEYFRVDVVHRDRTPKDLGNPLPYHPNPADPKEFSKYFNAIHDATIDSQYADRNFDNWQVVLPGHEATQALSVSGTQIIIIRWDLSAMKGKKTPESGLLQLSPLTVHRSSDYEKDFGMVRICEILAGDKDWNETTVTFDGFRDGHPMDQVINTQMIIDDRVTWNGSGNVLFTISQPVIQRLIDGRTLGLAVKPLGAVNASFYSRESGKPPRLYIKE